MTAIFAVIKRLFASNKISFILTTVVVLCATTAGDSQIALSNGNYTWLLAILTPFFFVFYDYIKLIHLGTSKKDYFLGSLVGYGLTALIVSLVNTCILVLIDPLNQTQTVLNLMDLCGWTDNSMFTAFLQQTVFLLLTMIFLHVLLSMQPYWYGWLSDGVLAAIICIFIPVAPLRHILAGFFKLIMFNSTAQLQIAVCLSLCALLSLAGLAVLKKKSL
ncbi:hypothetical protein [Anaeromassilibacillus senegalensis]|uniref:hypothetical protein n=1 Tax=Anaeromassilibacillus senegalensis TaxID=1673717 RepID=UPI00067F9CDE|nr:hypothetical protein [Anaeromassilibacillus senegalensis]